MRFVVGVRGWLKSVFGWGPYAWPMWPLWLVIVMYAIILYCAFVMGVYCMLYWYVAVLLGCSWLGMVIVVDASARSLNLPPTLYCTVTVIWRFSVATSPQLDTVTVPFTP